MEMPDKPNKYGCFYISLKSYNRLELMEAALKHLNNTSNMMWTQHDVLALVLLDIFKLYFTLKTNVLGQKQKLMQQSYGNY